MLPPPTLAAWLAAMRLFTPLHPPNTTATAEAALRRPHRECTHGSPRSRWSWKGKKGGGCRGEKAMARSNRGSQCINLSLDRTPRPAPLTPPLSQTGGGVSCRVPRGTGGGHPRLNVPPHGFLLGLPPPTPSPGEGGGGELPRTADRSTPPEVRAPPGQSAAPLVELATPPPPPQVHWSHSFSRHRPTAQLLYPGDGRGGSTFGEGNENFSPPAWT